MGLKGSMWQTKVIERVGLFGISELKSNKASIIYKHVNTLNIGHIEWNKKIDYNHREGNTQE